MSSIVFVDPTCARPYSTETLSNAAIGGTEASVVRIADALGAYVMQHNRREASGRYRPLEPIAGIDRVVLVRDSRALPAVRRLFPSARVFLWLHDKVRPRSKRGRWFAATAKLLCEMAVTVVCVSDSQRSDVVSTLQWIGIADAVPTVRIYNPVDDALAPDGSPVDGAKLVFFSSPNKGLALALDAFRTLRRAMPDLRLVVGNPGYKIAPETRIEGVAYLGPQPQWRIHAEVRTALCTFHPNLDIPETFGMVYAESKALGTPVLAHRFGAAAEVIADPQQILAVTPALRVYEQLVGGLAPSWRAVPARLAGNLGLFDPYVERIRRWREGDRPTVGPDPRFRMTTVVDSWRQLLETGAQTDAERRIRPG
jgi:glycosyltransferase involved in cell wall biosynthesis